MSAYTVGMVQAKAELSALVDRVTAGETVLILRRGKPVAMLIGILAGQQSAMPAPESESPGYFPINPPAKTPHKPANRAAPGLTLAEITKAGRP